MGLQYWRIPNLINLSPETKNDEWGSIMEKRMNGDAGWILPELISVGELKDERAELLGEWNKSINPRTSLPRRKKGKEGNEEFP
ncbi:hypothetical protein OPV22_031908 [Ensete ventricosum]|uniref:Uncharacterized protein n=1 Tax=Ensete ventricosum TaxID=4639 RepID=A0AAV8PV46_ENSVE|nr:hypothetical protein OPV22_031908 [Ensete ventricosum]